MNVQSKKPPEQGLERDVEKVLVVDDSRAQRTLLSRTLGNWGYDVHVAENGRQALDVSRDLGIGFVLSDWRMPGMSGLEFCRTFKTKMDDGPSYFILLTAKNDSDSLAEGLNSGADDFLSKPVNPTELRARLRAGERVLRAQRSLGRKNVELSSALDMLSSAYSAIDSDLREARKFQESLVPERFVVRDRVTLSLAFRPSGHVGGDMIGYFPIRDDEMGVYAVDVSGHGVSSALMTARIASYFSDAAPERNIALESTADGFRMAAPDVVCSKLNEMLCRDTESDLYLTMVLAHLNTRTGGIRMCVAGHPPPMILRKTEDALIHNQFGMPIGLIEAAEYQSSEVGLASGDRMLVYSDGITECHGGAGHMYGEDRLLATFERNRPKKGQVMLDALVGDVERFAGTKDVPDDLSAVLIEFD